MAAHNDLGRKGEEKAVDIWCGRDMCFRTQLEVKTPELVLFA